MKETLLDLAKDNEHFDNLIDKYKMRIKTSLKFVDKQKFNEDERNRISASFIKPSITIRVNGKDLEAGNFSNSFSYAQYIQHAYTWLKEGNDYPIKNILDSAQEAYRGAMGIQPQNQIAFNKDVIDNLSLGVAYLLYERWLSAPQKENPVFTLKDISFNDKAYSFIIEMMDEFDITLNGKANLNAKQGGTLFAFIESIIGSKLLKAQYKQYSRARLLKILNSHLGTTFREFDKRADCYEENLPEMKAFVKRFK